LLASLRAPVFCFLSKGSAISPAFDGLPEFSDLQRLCRTVACGRQSCGRCALYPPSGISRNAFVRALAAIFELTARAGLRHRRPAFSIDAVMIGGQRATVREVTIHQTPFCRLLEKDVEVVQLRVLLVAPMSGRTLAGIVRQSATLFETPSRTDRCRPLWRLQRTALEKRDLPNPDECHLRQ
jgi:hypothetical protein